MEHGVNWCQHDGKFPLDWCADGNKVFLFRRKTRKIYKFSSTGGTNKVVIGMEWYIIKFKTRSENEICMYVRWSEYNEYIFLSISVEFEYVHINIKYHFCRYSQCTFTSHNSNTRVYIYVLLKWQGTCCEKCILVKRVHIFPNYDI